MHRILPKHIRPQFRTERSVMHYVTEPDPKLTIITHDGRYELVRYPAATKRAPDAYQWVDGEKRADASKMVHGLPLAIEIGHARGWQMWAGTKAEALPLIKQWERPALTGFARRG